uniref:Knottins-like domain-containing protein n=1 Tax=Tanacetum cinerariifolium TaxID=118510 RepID=A0A699HNH4_TANCI|nr:hypothetical protein [Tanacetum cinerariifolium]
MDPNSVDKDEQNDVQLQNEDIVYDIDLYFGFSNIHYIISMAKNNINVGVVFLVLVLLLVPYEGERGRKMMMVVEARTCESPSHEFKGPCVSDHNCGLVCKNEGFTDGSCRGFHKRCFCTKNC